MNVSPGTMVGGLLLLWLPLLVGFFTGRWVLKRVTNRMETLAKLASSSFALPSALVSVMTSMGLMMATSVYAPKTLAWLQVNDVLPFTPTLDLLRIVSWVAAFLVGYNASALFRGSATTQPATAPTVGLASTPPPQGNKHSGTTVIAFMCATVAAGLALGFVVTGMQKGGFLRTSDVGHLSELATIQEQLRPLESCEILYRQVDGKGRRKYPDSVLVRDCSGNSSRTIFVSVSTEWVSKNVSFEMSRGSTSSDWSILVDKDEVPFPALKAALEQFAPLIVAEYPRKAQEARQRQEEYERERDERRRAEETKESAKSTYPE